jgi:DNA-binding LacI/PurR family transcriptional regulator
MQGQSRSAPKRLTGSGPAPSVGFLIDWLGNSPYQWQILRGAMRAAEERRAHLLCFVGGTLAPGDPPNPANGVFELARPRNIDGVAVLSSSLGNAAGLERLKSFVATFTAVPTCSIAVPLSADISSVCPDNAAGMRAVVEHLIHVHAIKRIAFVRGPATSDEAELRFRVYRETIESSGIRYARELVVDGDFNRPAGHAAVSVLFGTRALSVSDVGAIVAANDLMALGALDELRERGIRVPEQIAVAGFDDVKQSAFASPPLTTARQKLEELGSEGVRMVLDQLGRPNKPEQSLRHTELVTRRSCGCPPGGGLNRRSSVPAGPSLGFDAAIVRRRQNILAEMARAARGTLGAAGSQWDARLLNAVSEQVRGDGPDAFLRVYDEILRRLVAAGSDVSVCNDVLSVLRARVVRAVSDPVLRNRVEDSFHEARVMTSNAVEGLQAVASLRTWDDALHLMGAGAAMMAARTMDELARIVHERLPAAGIPRCFIVRLDESPGAPPLGRVVHAEKPDARKSDPTLVTTYPLADVLRQVMLDDSGEHAFAIFPASYANGDRAIIAVELGHIEGFGYEALRLTLTSALSRMPV